MNLAATPLGSLIALEGLPLILVLKRKNVFLWGGIFNFFPAPKKIIINLPGTHEKQPCKGEPCQFSG